MSQCDAGAVLSVCARDIVVTGRVQGVGFRPFVYRMAHRFGLRGWVRNASGQVQIHVEGAHDNLTQFETALVADAPPVARARVAETHAARPEGASRFEILGSEGSETVDIHLPPDLFCCEACIAEMQTPSQRRYFYPFTNCTQCGPRYTIIEALPYDRANTSMTEFPLCGSCRAEYENPLDRRFHAQPLGCPDCGPAIVFNQDGRDLHRGGLALSATIALLRDGGIVAVKGIGGYHLMCDAENDNAICALRLRKNRSDKPLAVMVPQAGADGLAVLRKCVVLDAVEAVACLDAARPIVLARKLETSRLSEALAPGLTELGVFLPYSPLHHLLLKGFGGSLVATSGNVSGEPVITDNVEAGRRLGGMADAFLHHDRLIVRPADDSVMRIIDGSPRVLRSGRGMAPLEMDLSEPIDEPVVAVGGHMKGAVALAWDRRAVISPHIGELDSPRSLEVFERVIDDLQAMYRVEAERLLCDANPSYASSRWASAQSLPVTQVQHHVAHASALAGEYPEISRWLTFAWDGIGLGADGTLWGGEAFAGAAGNWRRVGGLRSFHLLGGDRAAREPWRCSAALMWEAGLAWEPPVDGAQFAAEAWRRRIGCFPSSSIGRLFDAAASLVLDIQSSSYEGQGPMMFESIATADCLAIDLPLVTGADGIVRMDWAPLLPMLVDTSICAGTRAGIFHESLAQGLVAQALAFNRNDPCQAVGLTGGVFQNKLLSERIVALLDAHGIPVLQHRTVPANDGGLAFGQVIEHIHSAAATHRNAGSAQT